MWSPRFLVIGLSRLNTLNSLSAAECTRPVSLNWRKLSLVYIIGVAFFSVMCERTELWIFICLRQFLSLFRSKLKDPWKPWRLLWLDLSRKEISSLHRSNLSGVPKLRIADRGTCGTYPFFVKKKQCRKKKRFFTIGISVFSFMIVKQYCMFQKKYQICQTSCINRAKHIFLCEVK